MTSIPLLLNPAAGGGRCGARAAEAVRRLRAAGISVDVRTTQGPGHAAELAREAWTEGHRRLLCAGGDGTTFEVINGLFPRPDGERPVLGILPLGTGNSFLRDFGITTEDQALDAVVRGVGRPVDVVRVTHADGTLHYVNLLSIGFTSAVGATTNRWFKALGAAGYAVATVVEVARLKCRPFPHRLDGGPVDIAPYAFLSFSNSRCTGGDMQMAPGADVSDGRVDVVRIGRMGRVDLLRAFPRIYEGRHLEDPRHSAVTARSVELTPPEPLDCMIDGEVLRLTLHRLDVLHHALEILA